MGIDTLGFAAYFGLVDDESDAKAKRSALKPAREYSEFQGRGSAVGVGVPTASANSRRREREYQRAFDAWLASTPGTVEAVELLRKWMSMPSC